MTNSKNKKYFLLYANCIPVKGAKRSIICDLQLNRYRFIPNLLFDVIIENPNKSITEIKKKYENNLDEGIDLFFDLLTKENFGFYADSPLDFPHLDLSWDSPLKITNGIIDIDDKSNYNYISVIKQLNKINCEAIQIRFFDVISIELLKTIGSEIINSSFLYVEFIIKYSNTVLRKDLIQLVKSNPRIRIIFIYGSPKKKIINNEKSNLGSLVYLQENISSSLHCGIVNESYFNTNIQLFTESKNYNNCLNKKIAIDVNGNIKNCPSMSDSFGNVKNISVEKAIRLKEFEKYWKITKDDILVCKDCEFRYICTDCRAYIQDSSNILSKPAKCNYNPYEAIWA